MLSFGDLTDSITYGHDKFPALCSAQLELIDRIKVFGRIRIKLTREREKEIFDSVCLHIQV